ncbi:hypothetical protein MTR67_036275 [Solanum verrucosum]|uniref:Ulp1 protease family, C-terminal catalytic domain containing protein n=1 Tax=Solanum verrucosum TaxID=315347 RepID=A0AAF0ZMF5_SOLVR|nr:hypothetical protein MTR67_036275 [Solanum verrucosum]
MGNWENNQDALQMAILYFLHTFILAQTGDSSISVNEFLMVEDECIFKHCANTGGLAAFDLPEDEHAPSSSPPTTSVNPKIVQLNDIADFDDFSTRPLEQLLRRSSRVSDTSSPPPPKRNGPPTPAASVHGSADAQKVNYVVPDIKELKDHLKNYITDCEVGVSVNEGGHKVNVNAEDDEVHQAPQDLNKVIMDEDGADTVQCNIRHFVSDKITVDISDLTSSHDLLSDSQLPTDIPTTEIVVRSNSKTPTPRNMMPSRIIQSPYVTSFGSSDKGKEKLDDDVRLYFPFEGCGITYQASSKLIDEYMKWLTRGILKNHANKDCGLYVAIFAEYLSDQIKTSLVDFLPEHLRKRYVALLWSYSEKAKGAYVSENDDPPKPKGVVTPPLEEDLVHIV